MEMRKSLKTTIMHRDSLTSDEADELIELAVQDLMDHLDAGDLDAAESVCQDHFGLEPDYLDDLLPVGII